MNKGKNGEGHSSGYARLKQSKTLGEILDNAISFEKTARDYYQALSERLSNPLKELVEELAKEESLHYALFQEMKERDETQREITLRINTPVNDHKFSDYIHLPDLDEKPDDQSILQYAMGREHAAMEQYLALAQETPEGPIRDLFAWLAQEELEHKGELEKKYYELVYSTNV